MKSTKQYIEEAKAALGIESDYALAQKLGITRYAVSGYQRGTRTIDDYTAVKLAEILEIPEIEVISAANYEREKDSDRKAFWERKVKTATAAAVLLFVSASIPYEARAEYNSSLDDVYIIRMFASGAVLGELPQDQDIA